jgi:WD40 repeat protein
MSIVKVIQDTVHLFENTGNLIRTITGRAISAQLSPDESRIVLVTESGTAQLWDVRGNYLQDITSGAADARFSGDQIIVIKEYGPDEVRDARGNFLRNI